MSIRLVNQTPVIGAAPGETVNGRIELHNDGSTDSTCVVLVVGLATDATDEFPPNGPTSLLVPAGSSVLADIAIRIPRSLGIGQHAAAFEATSDRPDERAVLTPFTISIASVARVELTPQPSTIRARRRADFHLDVVNNEPQQVQVDLIGEAPDVDVAFTPSTLLLQPGQRAESKGRLKGPRNVFGEPIQHNILVTARGRASTTSVTAPYIQRPLFAHRLRAVVAGITVVALWLAAILGAGIWLANRDDGPGGDAELIGVDTDGDGIIDAFFLADGTPVTGTDTNGDGIPDLFIDADGNVIVGLDTDGDGIPDAIVDADGNEIAAVDTNGDGVPDALSDGSTDLSGNDQVSAAPTPSTTILRGTVKTAGNPSDVAITLTAIELGALPTDTPQPTAFRGAVTEAPTGKIWSARTATLADLAPTVRRTVAIAPAQTQPDVDGAFLLTDVARGQSYEVAFQQPGYDTQSFVITPPLEGDALELDIEMVPSKGSLGGRVVGPSGGLSGAEITVTDGSLVFNTTSTEGGAWTLDGVSTPGVYTVSAALRGYGTAVRQVELDAGDRPNGIDLQMVPGLGTMTGRVTDENGVGLGGVTVTASSGDTALTTSTLTEGNVGFFSLPQLSIPATYTVDVALDGYVTQSRRVALAGSVGNIDFSMTSTTVRLTGQVLSSAGGPIQSAGLTITTSTSTGDLKFRATTSESGVFAIDRLPPGNYTVLVEHFQHESATQFVTLQAGVAPAPLSITLQATEGPPALGTGSLVVAVVNSDPTIDPPGITGATVTLTRNRTTDAPRVIRDATSPNVVFTDLPIGTYTVRVTAPGYNASPPETKSVGFAQERIEIELQKLGQARGTIVDSLTGAVLTDYAVTIFQVRDSGLETRVGRFVENNGEWQTRPDDLSVGRYRIVIEAGDAPPGYVVRGDQLLADAGAVAGQPMTFIVPVVSTSVVEPIVVPPIEADSYPDISGRVYEPRLDGINVVYDPIDDPGLTVTGSCNGTPLNAADIEPVNDALDTSPGQLDGFFVDREVIARVIPAADLPGTCSFVVSAPGYTDQTVDLADVDANDGDTSSNRRVAVPLAKPAPTVSGNVFWLDTGKSPAEKKTLPNVAIRSTAPVITEFVPVESTATIAEPQPNFRTAVISTTSSAATGTEGDWTLQDTATGRRQIFGTGAYEFVAAGFGATLGSGLVPVTIDETAVANVPSSPPTASIVSPRAGGGYDVELEPPNPGSVSGRVEILTNRVPPNYALVRAITPNNVTAPRAPVTPDATGNFSFPNADAGTWTINFDTPPNHDLAPSYVRADGVTVSAGTDSRVGTVLPGTPTAGFDTRFVELGAVEVRLFDRATPPNPINVPARLEVTGFATASLPAGAPPASSAPNAPGDTYRLERLPVNATPALVGTDVPYTLKVSVDRFDTVDAIIDANPTGGAPTAVAGVAGDAGAISMPMRAGRVATFDIFLEGFGGITGSIDGEQEDGTFADLPFTTSLPGTYPSRLNVVRVLQPDCTPVPSPDPNPPAEVVLGSNGTFSIVGAPGFYQLTPGHDQYQAATGAAIPSGTLPLPTTCTLPANVFEIKNGSTNALGPYQLRLLTGSVDVSAVTDLSSSATAVTGASYTLVSGSATCAGDPAKDVAIDPNPFTITGLRPGPYCLSVNKFTTSGADDAFPAVVVVNVPRQLLAGPPATPTVIAPLPPLRPTLTGSLVGVNQVTPQPGRVPIVATDPVTLTSSYNGPTNEGNNVGLNGGTVPNLDTGAGTATAVAPTLPATPVPADYAWSYTFDDLPFGAHTITAPEIPGYTLLDPKTWTGTVSDTGPTQGPTFTYQVAPRAVEFDLGGGVFPSLDGNYPDTTAVSLKVIGASPPATYTTFTLDTSGGSNVLRFSGVAPDVRGYNLTFDDALHAAVDVDVVVPFVPSTASPLPPLQGGAITTTPDRVRLTGTATQLAAEGTSIALETGAVLRLSSTTGATTDPTNGPPYVVQPGPASGNTPGSRLDGKNYTIDAKPDTYRLDLTQSGYFSASLPSIDIRTAAGTVVTRNIEVVKKAIVTVKTNTAGLALPAGITYSLLNTNPSGFAPVATSDPTKFEVRPGTYIAQVSAGGGYPTQTSGDTPVALGSTQDITVTLPRIVRVVVTGAPSSAVAVTIGSSTPTIETPAGTFVFQFQSPDSAATGVLTAKVTATDTSATPATVYRTQTVSIPATIFNTVSVALKPEVTATGTILPGALAGTAVISASDGAGTTKQGNIVVDDITRVATYTIPGLGVGPNGEAKTWSITYDQPGVGLTGSAGTAGTAGTVEPVTLPQVTVDSANTITQDITLTVRPVLYNFTVTELGSSPAKNLKDATITIRNRLGVVLASGTSGGNGKETLSVPENLDATSWTVSLPGYLTASGTIGAVTSFTVDVPGVALGPPTFSGRVVTGAPATPVDGATVTICPATTPPATAVCTGSSIVATTGPTTTSGQFSFTTKLPDSTYRVWAVKGASSGSSLLSVDGSGAVLASSDILISP